MQPIETITRDQFESESPIRRMSSMVYMEAVQHVNERVDNSLPLAHVNEKLQEVSEESPS
ncbi:MAG: hypothetical protein QG574_3743 [Cyanobacteriota bacterium erpe_2018_sw_21hr_WHONDRS-SW48-000092_B_bin.40]|jgi:hypothetical protein|nr:hypothetical protein [Cyanobacteriota bacterium erpe_2018_sw_21hr_WHONDRS-SW48-000092_B_bin.40]